MDARREAEVARLALSRLLAAFAAGSGSDGIGLALAVYSKANKRFELAVESSLAAPFVDGVPRLGDEELRRFAKHLPQAQREELS